MFRGEQRMSTNGPSSQPVNNTQYSPSITHSMCLDGKHVAGPSGAARPGVNTRSLTQSTVSLSQGALERVSRGEHMFPR